jgi:tetraprenyl-beta-curcumene synthase
MPTQPAPTPAAPATAPRAPSASPDARVAASAFAALALANLRYWSGLAGLARAQVRHWRAQAERIEDPAMRELALAKLREESFNAQAAAVLATLAPRAHRPEAVRAIVALELLFDCLDGLTERPHPEPLAESERLFAFYLAAIDLDAPPPSASEDGYLCALAATVRAALPGLPGWPAVAAVARDCAARAAEAQARMHAARQLGPGPARAWAREGAQAQVPVHARPRAGSPATAHPDCPDGNALGWREYLAGSAASVLALHALIAAAADPRTSAQDAAAIDAAYMSICAVVTLLDATVDQNADAAAGERAYIELYESAELLSLALADTARDAARRAGALPSGPYHVMTLAGAIAYWCSHPAAREHPAAATLAPLRRQQRGLIAPPLAVMRAWRAAKRVKPC